MKELGKEIEERRAQSSGVLRRKETSEHRLDMAKQEVLFHSIRIQKMEANNMEISEELENTRTSLR